MGNQRTGDRRGEAERRQHDDRRRPSDARHAVFELCRSTLHLALVVRNGEEQTLVTRSVRWRTTATTLHTDRGVEELTEALRRLVEDERLAGAKVRIALSGEFCVTRVVTGPTDVVRREMSGLEERSLRYLTLGPGRKALSHSLQQLDARHQHALLTVTSQQTLDMLMDVANSVGLQIVSIEPSLIALSRAQANLRDDCRDACLLIQLNEAAAELGVCHHGRLLLDYRPGGNTSAENIADVVEQHLSRLRRYLDRYHSYLEAPLQHIYLTGEPAAVEIARQQFARLPKLSVQVLDPRELNVEWRHAGAAPGTDMAAALGTALSVVPGTAESLGPNLIEGTLAQLRAPLRPILIRSLAPIAAMLLVAASLLVMHVWSRGTARSLRAELNELRPIMGRASKLRLQLTVAEAKLAHLRRLEEHLPKCDWQRLFARVAQSMPEDVWLDRLSIHEGQVANLGGASYTDSGVYDFVSYLKAVPDVAEVALEGTGVSQSPTGPTTTFNLKATLAEFAVHSESEGRND